MRKTTLAICLAALLPTAAFPQFDMGGASVGDSKPWASFKLNSATRVRLDFRNANVDNILSFYQKTTGVTIVKDPSLTGPLTLTSATPVTLNEAFQILSTTLSLKNYDLKKEGNLMVIRQRAQRGPEQARPQFDPSQIAAMMGGGESTTVLRVYQIQFASASQVARVLNDVFAQAAQNPFQALIGGAMQMQMGGRRGGPMGMMGGNRNSTSNVKASSDDFSNSVIVNAPEREQRQVSDLIKQIDKETDKPQTSKVYKLQFAASDEIVSVVQNVLTANTPTGRGSTTGSAGFGGGPFGGFMAMQNQNRSNSVVSEVRTNSLIVTCTEQNHIVVDRVVKELDKDIPIETSTFVFPLENARADSVATLLSQAFGSRTGANTGRNTGMNRNTGSNRTNNQRQNNQRNTGGGGFRGAANPGDPMPQDLNAGNFLPIDLEDPDAESGELYTAVGIQGGFFGGQGGQNRQGAGRTATGQTTGRDESGRLVNVRDLTNQVTVIPDPNTNSLIIVTTPDNAQLIRGILEQLDRIPEQVMIETMIVEASLDESSKFGIEWSLNAPNQAGQRGVNGNIGVDTGQDGRSALNGLKYAITGGNLDAFINLFKQDQRFQVLSTPRIFTSNNSQAEINISQSVPYVLSSREDANGNLTYNYAFQDVGIVLTVTPRITSNGYVTMEVQQTANDLQGYTSFNAPIVNQREANTTVSVKDGETIVLGGIIRNTVSSTVKKVPLLGDLPLLGNLFRSTSKEQNKTELLVFLTPRVVRDADEALRLREEQQKKLSIPTQKTIEKQLPPTEPRTGGTNKGDIG